MAELGVIVTYKPGEAVVKQGQVAKGIYMLMSGQLDVQVDGVSVAQIVDKGAFVGEIASLLGVLRTATVVAQSDASLLYVKNVTQFFEKNPSTCIGVAKNLAHRIIEMDDKIVALTNTMNSWISTLSSAEHPEEIMELRNQLIMMHQQFVQSPNR